MSGETLSKLRARIGGLALSAKRDSRAYTAAARARFLSKFDEQVDPDGTLPPAERQRRAEAAKKLYFSRMALQSAKVRQRRRRVAR